MALVGPRTFTPQQSCVSRSTPEAEIASANLALRTLGMPALSACGLPREVKQVAKSWRTMTRQARSPGPGAIPLYDTYRDLAESMSHSSTRYSRSQNIDCSVSPLWGSVVTSKLRHVVLQRRGAIRAT